MTNQEVQIQSLSPTNTDSNTQNGKSEKKVNTAVKKEVDVDVDTPELTKAIESAFTSEVTVPSDPKDFEYVAGYLNPKHILESKDEELNGDILQKVEAMARNKERYNYQRARTLEKKRTDASLAEQVVNSTNEYKFINSAARLALLGYQLDKVEKVIESQIGRGKLTGAEKRHEKDSLEKIKEENPYEKHRTVNDFWSEGITAIKAQFPNIEIVYTGEGDLGGYEFGELTDTFAKLTPHGLNCSTPVFETMSNPSKILELLSYAPKDTFSFWNDLWVKGSTSPICRYASKATHIEFDKSTSISGKYSAWKVTPALEDFDERIQRIDPYELMPLLNHAEATTTLIHLGRIAAGVNYDAATQKELKRNGCRVIEKFLDEKQQEVKFNFHYRYVMVHFGASAIGKSTFWDMLKSGLNVAGYTTNVMQSTFNQFGWGTAATSDLILNPDCNVKDLLEFQSSSNVKTIAAGEIFPNEKKGLEIKKSRASAALAVVCNEVRELPASKADRGVNDRMHFCQFKTQDELINETGFNNLHSYLTSMCKELNTTFEVLALYLLRRGLDLFLKEVGYTQSETEGVYDFAYENATLPTTIKTLKKQYIYKVKPDLKRETTLFCRKAYVISKLLNHKLPREYDASFHAYHLTHAAHVLNNVEVKLDKTTDENEEKLLNALLDWLKPDCLSTHTILGFHNRMYPKLQNEARDASVDFFWDEVKTLESTFGERLPTERSFYANDFNTSKAQDDTLIDQLQNIFRAHKVDVKILMEIGVPFRPLASIRIN